MINGDKESMLFNPNSRTSSLDLLLSQEEKERSKNNAKHINFQNESDQLPFPSIPLLIDSSSQEAIHAKSLSKLHYRILPLIFLLSFISYLDRTNLAFVAKDFQATLHLSDQSYALGAGFFFVGYSSFQVPSNRLLRRFGGIPWLSSLSILWGATTMFMSILEGKLDYWMVRCLLGVFEAGFYPGVVVYLRSFFGEKDFGSCYALILSATCVALATGGPVIAIIEYVSRIVSPDFDTWRSCFIVQGGLAILCGFLLILFQPRTIQSCSFLTSREKEIELEIVNNGVKKEENLLPLKQILSLKTMWYYSGGWFLYALPYWGFIYW